MKPDDRLIDKQWPWGTLKSKSVPNKVQPTRTLDLGTEPLPTRDTEPLYPVIVAVVDSGVNRHEDLEAHVLYGQAYSVIAGDKLRDDDDHGTQIAGMICAVVDDASTGKSGLKVLPIKFCSQQVPPHPDNAAAAIEHAVENGAQVIVLAWDCGFKTARLDTAIENANGSALIVAAAGNHGMDNDRFPNWPANYSKGNDHVVTVMAIDKKKNENDEEERASFSNYGKESVDLAAPGVEVWSTVPYYGRPNAGNSIPVGYRPQRGTSAATALVARLAALILERSPTRLLPSDLKARLQASVRPVRSLERFCVTGGVVDYEIAFAGQNVVASK